MARCGLPGSRLRPGPTSSRAHAAGRHRATPGPHPPLLFRGWLVVAGAFLVQMVGFGAAYSFAAFAEELESEFGASRSSVSMVYGICGFTSFAVSAMAGPLADRIGPRPLATAGMLLVALGLATAATARTLAEIYLCYGLVIGLGIGFSYVPAVAAVQRWFVTWRGVASGVAASGVGFGTALVPPAVDALTGVGGWRVAFLLCGLGAAVVGVAGALLLVSSPESRGLAPDGVAPNTLAPEGSADSPATVPPAGALAAGDLASGALSAGALSAGVLPSGAQPAGALLGEVVRQRRFWLLFAGAMLISMPASLPIALLARTAADAGLPRTEALALLGIVGIASIAGRLVLGTLADMVGRAATFIGCCAAVAALTLLWAAADEAWLFTLFALGFGVAYGGFVALLPSFTTDQHGRRSAGSVIGLLFAGRAVSLLLAAPLVVLLAEHTGGYGVGLSLAALLGVLGTVLVARTRAP